MKEILNKIDHVLNVIEDYILILTGTGITLMIIANTLFRAIAFDWFGSEELTLFVGVWVYFIGSICAARSDVHISGDMLNMFLKNDKLLFVFNCIKYVISIVMCGFFASWVFEFAVWQYSLGASSPVYKLPLIISFIPMTIFFFFWVIYLVRDFICLIIDNKTKEISTEGENL